MGVKSLKTDAFQAYSKSRSCFLAVADMVLPAVVFAALRPYNAR
jgi:hypothetical protein